MTFDPGGFVRIPSTWQWTMPDGVPDGQPSGTWYTDTPFSDAGSATSFTSVVSGTLYVEELRLWDRFFSAAVDMAWKNDCVSGNPSNPACLVYPVAALPDEKTFGAKSNSVLLVPYGSQFNKSQIGVGGKAPIGSGDFLYAELVLEQSLYKSVIVSGQAYNATWWIRSPGIFEFPDQDITKGLWNYRVGRFLVEYRRPLGTGFVSEYFGGATGVNDVGAFNQCLDRRWGCPIWVSSEPGTGSATLYLNDPLNPDEAPYTPYSFSFMPGSILTTSDLYNADGCAIDPTGQMNADLCQAKPQGTWTFAMGTWGTSGDSNKGAVCGTTGVEVLNSRMAGSVYIDGMTLSAARGAYISPVFDSLSPYTVWDDFNWDLELNENAVGPRTPVGLRWRASYSTTVFGTGNTDFTGSVTPGSGLAGCAFSSCAASATAGRFFQWRGDLRNWAENAANPPPLQTDTFTQYPTCTRGYPATYLQSIAYDGSLGPRVRQVAVKYTPFAGRFTSVPLSPVGLKYWKAVTYEKDDGGGTVTCDIVDTAGNVILANVTSGSLLNGIDVGKYPAIAVRFTLDKGPLAGANPKVHWFKLTYETMKGCLAVDRNALRLSHGDVAAIRFCTRTSGAVDLRIYDAAGQLVHRLYHGELRAGDICQKYWWGTSDANHPASSCDLQDVNPRGPAVAPGLYIVTVTTPGGRETARLAVSR